jgi:hypothetical protein
MNADKKVRRTNQQEITEETEIWRSPLFSLFAPVHFFRFLSVFHRCSIRGSALIAAEGRAKFSAVHFVLRSPEI